MNGQVYLVKSLNTGKIETYTYGKKVYQSAIKKQPVETPLFLSKLGFIEDEQAYEHHGGENKAVCVYPYDHYDYWRPTFKNMVESALFGENLTVAGLTEDKAHIGDTFSFGDAIVQISEPRNPCYKLAAKYEIPSLIVQVRNTGYTGFLMRVLKEGMVSVHDQLTLIERVSDDVSVALVNDVKFHDCFNPNKVEKVLQVKELSESIRSALQEQYETGKKKGWG
ncbi:MOSC domain-containing protein [Paenibacillus sp. N1-5-1-14]|uniref:MOSC domain-containing protein n=1 Tax=Paenibacillus radicibacter TaxID=2972488 RepID=UPI002159A95A|nr:MOSC domain-containing protein [Paenibacillus radicibacter]MCR8645995.1 MOSC domain-containing protein [Paenibacillus radicibacter]